MKSNLKLLMMLFALVFVACSNNEPIEESNSFNLKESKKDKCETAFAYCDKGCFLDDGFNRWGWRVGPFSQPTKEECIIYAGAGQCDLEKGEAVGYFEITYDEEGVEVHYHAYDGYLFTETHLYVGNAMYPTKPNGQQTVAPGQYPYSQSDSDGTELVVYELDDSFTGEIYVIAHAVVCPK